MTGGTLEEAQLPDLALRMAKPKEEVEKQMKQWTEAPTERFT